MERFSHSVEEIQAGMLLQTQEIRPPVEKIIPELEVMLTEGYIPTGGISKANAQVFPCSPQLQEVFSYGLLDPNLHIDSSRQLQTEGKIIADTGAEILIGLTMDNIYNQTFKDASDCSLESVYRKIKTLQVGEHASHVVSEGYLFNTQLVLLDYFRHMLSENLRNTLHNITILPDDDPYKILYQNITVASGYKNPYDFINRGIVSQTNNLYALLQLITVRAKEDVPLIHQQNGEVTREQTVNIYHGSRSALLRGLAKNDKDLFQELINEGIPQDPQVGDGILTKGQLRSHKQHMLVTFLYKPEAFRIVPSDKPETLGVVVLKDVRGTLLQADKNAYEYQKQHPDEIRAEPRVVFGCPARAPRAYGKPNAIKYIHQLSVSVLQKLNEHYGT